MEIVLGGIHDCQLLNINHLLADVENKINHYEFMILDLRNQDICTSMYFTNS
jgi:hypothetical protein